VMKSIWSARIPKSRSRSELASAMGQSPVGRE
jgi:hypothetical protein